MSWLKEQTGLLVEFIGTDFRRTILHCAIGMVLAAALGGAVGIFAPETVVEILNSFMKQVQEAGVVDEAGNFSVFALMLNNWRAMLLSAGYGFVPFLFLPLVSLLTNGALLGMLGALYFSGGSLLVYLAGILPHGVFELPALVLSISCGVSLCKNMCRMVTGSPKRIPMVELLGDLLRVLLFLVMPLTVAAAFIECYVTPVVLGLFL